MKRTALVLLLTISLLAMNASLALAAGNPPAAPIYGAGSGTAIEGRYIVVFKPGSAGNEVKDAANRARGLGSAIFYTYDAALTGFAASLPEKALQGLVHNPNVDYIEADQVITLEATQSPATWGIDRIDQRARPLSNSYTYNSTGAGVTAYIIDTGILTTHNEFGGRASSGYDFVDNDSNAADCNGHGTHVSGTVAGDRTPVDGSSTANGMAHKARIFMQDITPGADNVVYPPDDLGLMFITAYNGGARLHTNSWGNNSRYYGPYAVSTDRFLWDHKEFLALFANGNAGPGTVEHGTGSLTHDGDAPAVCDRGDRGRGGFRRCRFGGTPGFSGNRERAGTAPGGRPREPRTARCRSRCRRTVRARACRALWGAGGDDQDRCPGARPAAAAGSNRNTRQDTGGRIRG